MNRIDVLCLDRISKESSFEEIEVELDKQHKHTLEYKPWKEFDYKPFVEFTIGYNDCIFLKYNVKENAIRACYHKTNDPVYKDSCVEYFVSINDEPGYYNFEFNCIGTCLAGFRKQRSIKKSISEKNISKIKTKSIITKPTDANPDWHWELTMVIPLEVFEFHELTSLKNIKCKGNFYKCGDELPWPHYLSWNNIIADKPNFHLPEFFGELNFT